MGWKRVGYPLGFAIAGSVAPDALLLFVLMLRMPPAAALSDCNAAATIEPGD